MDQLAETPEFKQWVEREFPEGASEWSDPVSRRHFVKIMSASFMLAGMGLAGSGCRRPEEKILPFSKMPENYVHGVAQFYATAMPTRCGAIPLVVKSNDGRPTKLEGNPSHPDSNGGTDRWAQASILNLYDPDRAQACTNNGKLVTEEVVADFLTGLSKSAQENGGQGLAFLLERNTSPSRLRLQKALVQKLPQAKWYVHEAIDVDAGRRAASQAFGKPVKPFYQFDAAKVIVSLDCDFIGSEEDAHNNIKGFSKGRSVEENAGALNRLYAVESLMTLTGFNSDHRLRIPCSAVAQVAAGLAAGIGGIPGVPNVGALAGVDPNWITECAKDLAKHKGQSLVVAGYRQPLAVHLLAHAMNAALGNVGKTVLFHEIPDSPEGSLTELASALTAGQVATLIILGANPVYNAAADLNWVEAQKKAKTVVRLGYYEDETSLLCHWHLPMAHYLESWGDALTSDGTLVPVQPLIAPLFGGWTEIQVLARLAGEKAITAYEVVRETFAALAGAENVEERWKKFLFDGFLPGSAAKPAEVKFNEGVLSQAAADLKPSLPSKDKLEVVFQRDYSVDDGRYSNNGWLQEMPDPVTKMVWDNAVLISRKTAQELGFKNMEVVEIKLGGKSIQGPIWVQPGQADYSLGLPLGYGRDTKLRVGRGVGFDAYPLRTTTAQNFAVGATITATGKTYTLACTQDHWSMEGRPIIREANLEQFQSKPDFAKAMKQEEPPVVEPLYANPLKRLEAGQLGTNGSPAHHQWGMSIDLNKCVGCQACMMACQSENNVPIVGKDQVRRGREMHWIRIDRYYAGSPKKTAYGDTFITEEKQQFEQWIDDPQAVTQPMLCQHCEAAPCENVCPVNATVHDQEGLNLMVYNRCVGTRYCSNNCPYKVRRFNYFDYNKRGIGKNLYWGPLRHRPEDEYDLVKMIKNPDVTVRMRGVMEKCTYCIQRIEGAKIAQKVKAGASNDVIVPTDSFTTACAQACPANAIVFGNISDPKSRVSQLKKKSRDYAVLEFLLTKPRTTYLAKVRNPNPAMPDYVDFKEGPWSLQNYETKMGNPFVEEGEKHGAEAAAPKGAE